MTERAALKVQLAHLVADRRQAAEHLVAAARRAGAAAMLAVGSMAARTADPFSDVDLLLIHHGYKLSMDIAAMIGQPVLAADLRLRPRRTGLGLTAIGVEGGLVITWLNVFHWCAASAKVPVDSLILFDAVGLPYSPHRFAHLLHRRQPSAAPVTSGGTLRQIAADAKRLARAPSAPPARAAHSRAVVTADQLRRGLAAIDATGLRAAIGRTGRLIDLAETARNHQQRQRPPACPLPQPLCRCPPTARAMPCTWHWADG